MARLTHPAIERLPRWTAIRPAQAGPPIIPPRSRHLALLARGPHTTTLFSQIQFAMRNAPAPDMVGFCRLIAQTGETLGGWAAEDPRML